MKKIILVSLIFLSLIVFSQRLQVYYYQSTFWNPKQGPYTETYITFIGNTFTYVKTKDNKYNCMARVTLKYMRSDSIISFNKVKIPGIPTYDNNLNKINFVDIERLSVPPGKYDFEIIVEDIFDTTNSNTLSYKDTITIPKYNEVGFSDVELIESLHLTEDRNKLSKYGYDIIPYVSDFYPSNVKELIFLIELYNTDKIMKEGEDFAIRYYIEPTDKSTVLEKYNVTERYKAKKINIILKKFDIKQLPSGNYNLIIEAFDRNKETFAKKKLFFQRSNKIWDNKIGDVESTDISGTFVEPINNKDTIIEYIKCLLPILEANESTHAINQLKTDNRILMKKYFYSYWESVAPVDPEGAWKKYKKAVDRVNENYSTQIKKGYETDRGRIYLKYGPPNSIIKRDHAPGTFPYEIWHYYQLKNQGNKRVVFYNPNIVGEDYELVHTDIRGEISNPNWKSLLIRNAEEYNSSFGNTLKDDYQQ